ncbi:hypothetical protein ACFS07_14020 [Undibacterium arcticum]
MLADVFGGMVASDGGRALGGAATESRVAGHSRVRWRYGRCGVGFLQPKKGIPKADRVQLHRDIYSWYFLQLKRVFSLTAGDRKAIGSYADSAPNQAIRPEIARRC